LKKIKAMDSTSKWQALKAAIKAKLKEGETSSLFERMDECRKQTGLQLQWLTRYGMGFTMDLPEKANPASGMPLTR
jgi:hypothetical protein